MAKVEIVAERCKSCGYCVKFCPRHVLEIGAKVNSKGYEYVTPARRRTASAAPSAAACARTAPSTCTNKGVRQTWQEYS